MGSTHSHYDAAYYENEGCIRQHRLDFQRIEHEHEMMRDQARYHDARNARQHAEKMRILEIIFEKLASYSKMILQAKDGDSEGLPGKFPDFFGLRL